MSSVFTRMLQGQEPARFLWKDDHVAAIVSNTPVRPGHAIVFPREPVENWLDLPPELAGHLMGTCRTIGRAVHEVYRPVRVGLAIISIVVPHVHIHLVPINTPAELDFTKQDQNASPADLDASAERLRAAMARSKPAD